LLKRRYLNDYTIIVIQNRIRRPVVYIQGAKKLLIIYITRKYCTLICTEYYIIYTIERTKNSSSSMLKVLLHKGEG